MSKQCMRRLSNARTRAVEKTYSHEQDLRRHQKETYEKKVIYICKVQLQNGSVWQENDREEVLQEPLQDLP